MGQSTDGQICYGVKFEEDFEFPWDDDPYLDEDDWWLEGASEAEIDEHRRDWLKAHPLPFELVNYCHADCPMYILAVPGTLIEANRGCPVRIHELKDPPKQAIALLLAFCKEYNLTYDGEPGWWLSSYWG